MERGAETDRTRPALKALPLRPRRGSATFRRQPVPVREERTQKASATSNPRLPFRCPGVGALPAAGAAGPRDAAVDGESSRERWRRPPSRLPRLPQSPLDDRCPTSSQTPIPRPPTLARRLTPTRAGRRRWSPRRSIGSAPCGFTPALPRCVSPRA